MSVCCRTLEGRDGDVVIELPHYDVSSNCVQFLKLQIANGISFFFLVHILCQGISTLTHQ